MLFNNLLVFARSRDRESRQIVELRLELESVWVDDLKDLDPLGGAHMCVYHVCHDMLCVCVCVRACACVCVCALWCAFMV